MVKAVRDEDGKELWRAWRQGAAEAEQQEAPDSLTLAAWLEGRLGEAEAAAVERWLALAPDAAETVRALREALEAEPSGTVPQRLLLRLRALGPAPLAGRKDSPLGRTFAASFLRVAASWAAVLLLAAAISGGSFWMGQETRVAEAPEAVSLDELALLGEPDSLL